jgi:predicted MFS family arabinose efflux permease
LLRDRNFRRLFSAQAASVFGDRMVAVALAFGVLEIGGSTSAVGLVLASGAVPLVACLLIGGVVADRVSRRAVMVAADLVRVASQGLMAALLIGGAAELWMLALLAGVTGAATGFFNPASTALMPAVVPPERLQEANGLRATARSAGEILGPVVAGVLVASAGAGWAIAVDASTFAISAAFLARLRVRQSPPRTRATFLTDLKGGWTAFTAQRWIWAAVASISVTNMLWGAWSALGPVVADRDLGGPGAWGAVLASMGVGALAGSLVATRVRPRRPLVLFGLAGIVISTPLAFLAAGVPVVPLAVVAAVAGGAMMLGNSVWESTLQRHIPEESLSRVAAYDWFGSSALYPVGLAVWGPLAAAIGIGSALWVAFALFLAGTAWFLALPDVRSVGAEPAGSARD